MTEQILLIGGASPIGRAVSTELNRQGRPSIATSRRGVGDSSALDVDDEVQVGGLLAEISPTSVVYLASPTMTGDAETSSSIALASLQRFITRAADHGTRRLVFASSASVYGTADPTPRHEGTSLRPENAYGRFKVSSETLLEKASTELGVSVVALRIFNVYGPMLESSLINRMFSGDRAVPEVFSTTEYVRDYVHVTDVARAFAITLDDAPPGYTAVNVGTGIATDNVSLLAHANARGTPRTPPSGFSSYSVAAVDSVRSLFGFEASIDLEDALNAPDEHLR